MFPLAETAAKMRDQHLPDRVFIAHQLHQLVDAIVLQQLFRPLLLQCQSGVMEAEPGAFTPPGFRLPFKPALVLHRIQQVAHVPAGAAQL